MHFNIGKIDRFIRIILGFVIIVLGLVYQTWWGAAGLLLLLTGAVRWCPLYIPFKINTDKPNQA